MDEYGRGGAPVRNAVIRMKRKSRVCDGQKTAIAPRTVELRVALRKRGPQAER